MKFDFSHRIGFVVNEVGRLYGRRFDQLARQELGLSRAQCRLLGLLATQPDDAPRLSQTAIADRLDLTPMAVAGLVDRMEAAGWLRREPSATDRRVNELALQPPAQDALHAALVVGDRVQAQALKGLSAEEAEQLRTLLLRVRANLQAADTDTEAPPAENGA